MDSDTPQVDIRAAQAGPFMRLQVEISNTVAGLDLTEEEARRLAGNLCGRAQRWIENVYQAECLQRKEPPRRRRRYGKMVG